MRIRGTLAIVLAVALIGALLTVGALAGGEGEAKPSTSETPEKAEKVEKTEAKVKEEKAPVMATLTYFEESGGKKGARKTREVEYLPEGTKIATMETSKGVVKIELWEDKAPNTVTNFVHLANTGRYDGVEFHRVIDGFMAQTGDVQHRGGTGGPGYSIPAEFDAKLKHERGVVSMARASDPDSAGSQFFIMFKASSHLDGQYAAFGKVIEGMAVIDSIKRGEPVPDPDTITKLRVVSVPVEKVEKKVEKKSEGE